MAKKNTNAVETAPVKKERKRKIIKYRLDIEGLNSLAPFPGPIMLESIEDCRTVRDLLRECHTSYDTEGVKFFVTKVLQADRSDLD